MMSKTSALEAGRARRAEAKAKAAAKSRAEKARARKQKQRAKDKDNGQTRIRVQLGSRERGLIAYMAEELDTTIADVIDQLCRHRVKDGRIVIRRPQAMINPGMPVEIDITVSGDLAQALRNTPHPYTKLVRGIREDLSERAGVDAKDTRSDAYLTAGEAIGYCLSLPLSWELTHVDECEEHDPTSQWTDADWRDAYQAVCERARRERAGEIEPRKPRKLQTRDCPCCRETWRASVGDMTVAGISVAKHRSMLLGRRRLQMAAGLGLLRTPGEAVNHDEINGLRRTELMAEAREQAAQRRDSRARAIESEAARERMRERRAAA